MADGRSTVWVVETAPAPERVVRSLTDEERAWLLDERPGPRLRAATRAALRELVGDATGTDPSSVVFDRVCRHCDDPGHGKPRAAGGPSFSVSHTDGLALVAIGGAEELGVDLERGDRRTRVRDRVLTGRERERLAVDDTAGLLQLWSAKEAVAKADGRGITLRFDQLEIADELVLDDRRWFVRELELPPPYLGSLVSSQPVAVELRTWVW